MEALRERLDLALARIRRSYPSAMAEMLDDLERLVERVESYPRQDSDPRTDLAMRVMVSAWYLTTHQR